MEKKRGKKRARASTTTESAEKPNGRKSRKSSHPASSTPPASLANVPFKPPTGSWEAEVQGIDACEGTDGQVMVFLSWPGGYKTQHPLDQVYKRCPQKVRGLLQAYQSAY
jgi:chromobox protein 1